MQRLTFSLFGKMNTSFDGKPVKGCEGSKVQELLCYLLLNRDRSHSREVLASLLWGDYCTTTQSKKYLRKALWQLQTSLSNCFDIAESGLFQVDAEWIKLCPVDCISIDVAQLESIYSEVAETEEFDENDELVCQIEQVEALYKGKLLENWFHEWCLAERERLHLMYLLLLEKLVAYHRNKGNYLKGLEYGFRILSYDRARESTHCEIMRLFRLSGRRTDALHQYLKCKEALKEELDVQPSRATERLYAALKEDLPIPNTTPEVSRLTPDITRALFEMQDGMIRLNNDMKRILSAIN